MDDRLCARCGANLIDRPIEREARYGLLVARCPHCDQAAPVEEYPPLDRWAARWALLAAALWLLILVAAAVATLAPTIGLTVAGVVESTDRAERALRDSYQGWTGVRGPGDDARTFQAFWAEQGAFVLAHAGAGTGWLAGVEAGELPLLLIPCGMALGLGCFWSVALLHCRRWKAAALPWVAFVPVLLLVAGLWWLLASVPPRSSEHAAWVRLRFPMMLMTLPAVGACLSLGIILGRSLLRALVRAFLAPRLRSSLAVLWTAEGLAAPVPPPARGGRSP
jgi:hypothetical protein